MFGRKEKNVLPLHLLYILDNQRIFLYIGKVYQPLPFFLFTFLINFQVQK